MPRPRRHAAARDQLETSSSEEIGATPDRPRLHLVDDVVAHPPVVHQAAGMVMAYYGVPALVATAALCRWAEHAGLSVVHLAAGVVEAGSQPSPHPMGALRRILRDFALDLDALRSDDQL